MQRLLYAPQNLWALTNDVVRRLRPAADYPKRSTEEILQAFAADGYKVVQQVEYQGKRGFLAESLTATNYESGKPKRAMYVEGRAYQMGYLIGRMAPEQVETMCNEYVYNFIPAMIDPKLEQYQLLWRLIWEFITLQATVIRLRHPFDIPRIYRDEMKGMVAGCRSVNPRTKVELDKLWNLNTAIDLLLACFYTAWNLTALGDFLRSRVPGFDKLETADLAGHLRVPALCNGFAVRGAATASGHDHYFGRDFMLTTAGVLQFTACMIVYCPEDRHDGRDPRPFVSMSAPGFVGSIAAMNDDGIGTGVDAVVGSNCDSRRPGFNSILLIRHLAQYAGSAQEAAAMTVEAQRGCAWLYVVADGKNDRAVVLEAGRKRASEDFLDSVPVELRPLMPDQAFLDSHPSVPFRQGVMERWDDFSYPEAYFSFNRGLFDHFGKRYDPADFGPVGFIVESYMGTNCPLIYYFAPQRETRSDVVLVTNFYLLPEIRLAMMNPWTVLVGTQPPANLISKVLYDDIQWRYDELNKLLHERYGKLDFDLAQETINYLNPDGQFPEYYTKNPPSSDGKTKVIEGSTSVCDLKSRVIRSHFGYYADEWVRITLPNYVRRS